MAGVLRFGVIGVIHRSSSKPLAKATIPALTQTCGIAGKILRATKNIQKPKPYPYKDKDYGFLNAVFDRTTKRFDDNSKVRRLFPAVNLKNRENFRSSR
jgi:NADH dehydrogenase (ubiquinone) 1 alpha subcomplex subunit 10